MNQPQKVNINELNPQELYQLKQGFQNQIGQFTQSLNQLRFASDKYEEGKRSIKAIDECKQDQEMLLPLSNSLYIEGYLNNTRQNQKVYLIEYGAGFFVERNAKESIEFYSKKTLMIKERTQKLQEIINQKRQELRIVESRMLALIQQQQQQQTAQKV